MVKYEAAISDTDILINLAKVGKFNILELLFSKIVVPFYIYDVELRKIAGMYFPVIETEILRPGSIFELVNREEDIVTNKLAKPIIKEYNSLVGPGESECAGYAEAFRIPIIISDNRTEFHYMDDRYIMLTHIDLLVLCTRFGLLSDVESESIYNEINNLLTRPSGISFDSWYIRCLENIEDKMWNKPLGLE